MIKEKGPTGRCHRAREYETALEADQDGRFIWQDVGVLDT
ncbi:MAG: hypothetical protein KatS3mg122_2452 [Caldimonas sp.]|nr:MAG: hypothetical protein KatS3mg122_2452 [Caldimonas sp.]